mmetsp:Transcript_126299/g.306924  ORF Transcript_126299/g.306924 Transcript_126299/m.306924 type:complete len:140 (-) Transcript_126299:31-450(-)
MILPPPAPEANPLKSVPRSLFKCMLNVFDQIYSDELGKHTPSTTWPVPEMKQPYSSMGVAGRTVISAKYSMEYMTVHIEIYEKIPRGPFVLDGEEVMQEAKSSMAADLRVIFRLVPKPVILARAVIGFKSGKGQKLLMR